MRENIIKYFVISLDNTQMSPSPRGFSFLLPVYTLGDSFRSAQLAHVRFGELGMESV